MHKTLRYQPSQMAGGMNSHTRGLPNQVSVNANNVLKDVKTKQATSAAPGVSASRLSRFELLPLEIREIVYELLGFPIHCQADRCIRVSYAFKGKGSDKFHWFKATVTRYEFREWYTALSDTRLDTGFNISYQHHPLLKDVKICDVVSAPRYIDERVYSNRLLAIYRTPQDRNCASLCE